MVVVAVVLAALAAATLASVLRPGPLAVVAVAAAGVAWWLVNGPVEGPVLHVVSPSHGLTVADLLVPPALAVAVVAAALARRRRRAGDRSGRPRRDARGAAPTAPR
ncbi:hypothetical protein WDZ17_15845 [Pseudokineococcus basanitobsidens]|uniref:Lycopene cyclase domain-containing protein n=1 Tax=Pseudokineococcus basanitobsidens TaxID=1926649 RepID=A0ABU8RNX7_9ACTN